MKTKKKKNYGIQLILIIDKEFEEFMKEKLIQKEPQIWHRLKCDTVKTI